MSSFPVTESTLSALHLNELLQDKYSLTNDSKCRLLRTGMNHLYEVTDGMKRYVLRVYAYHWRSREEITEEIRLLLHLEKAKVAVSYPLADKRGEYLQEISAPEGVRYGVLFSYAEGKKKPQFDTQTAYNIGIAMAKMHMATVNFDIRRMTYDTGTLLDKPLLITTAFFEEGTESMHFITQLTGFLNKQFADVAREEIRHGAIHLDMWFDNMHMTDDGRITFFDFDFCGYGWQCLDISYFMYQLLNTQPNDYEIKSKAFLEGYESIMPLTDEEKRILPMSCLGVMTFYLSMQCEKFDTWSNIFLNEDHLKRYVAALKRWMDYHKIEM